MTYTNGRRHRVEQKRARRHVRRPERRERVRPRVASRKTPVPQECLQALDIDKTFADLFD